MDRMQGWSAGSGIRMQGCSAGSSSGMDLCSFPDRASIGCSAPSPGVAGGPQAPEAEDQHPPSSRGPVGISRSIPEESVATYHCKAWHGMGSRMLPEFRTLDLVRNATGEAARRGVPRRIPGRSTQTRSSARKAISGASTESHPACPLIFCVLAWVDFFEEIVHALWRLRSSAAPENRIRTGSAFYHPEELPAGLEGLQSFQASRSFRPRAPAANGSSTSASGIRRSGQVRGGGRVPSCARHSWR